MGGPGPPHFGCEILDFGGILPCLNLAKLLARHFAKHFARQNGYLTKFVIFPIQLLIPLLYSAAQCRSTWQLQEHQGRVRFKPRLEQQYSKSLNNRGVPIKPGGPRLNSTSWPLQIIHFPRFSIGFSIILRKKVGGAGPWGPGPHPPIPFFLKINEKPKEKQ